MRIADERVLARLERDLERALALGGDVGGDVDAARPREVEVVRARLVVDDERVVAGRDAVGALEADVEAGADASVEGRAAAALRRCGRRPGGFVVVAAAAGEADR